MTTATPSLCYAIDASRGLVFIDLLAVSPATAVAKTTLAAARNPAFDETFDFVIDCTRVHDTPTLTDLFALAEQWRRVSHLLPGRFAIVAESEVGHGMARAFEVFCAAPPERVCAVRSHEEAERWLAIATEPAGV